MATENSKNTKLYDCILNHIGYSDIYIHILTTQNHFQNFRHKQHKLNHKEHATGYIQY